MHVKKVILFLFCSIPTLTHAETCPPAAIIRAAQFTQAVIYDKSDDIWELNTNTLTYADKQWTLFYGLYLPAETNTEEALERGQQQYQSVILSNLNPYAVPIPGYWLCDYTDGGMPWVQATTASSFFQF